MNPGLGGRVVIPTPFGIPRPVGGALVWACLLSGGAFAQPTTGVLDKVPRSGSPSQACATNHCEFQRPHGGEIYVLKQGELTRLVSGEAVYALRIVGRSERHLASAMNSDRSLLAVAVVRESNSEASFFTPGAQDPTARQREARLSIRNPKSGAEIKAIGLGQFEPRNLAVSEPGDRVWMSGTDVQRGSAEIRAYNTRSGALEVRKFVEDVKQVGLFADGYADAQIRYRLRTSAGGSAKRLSANPYSIAEFSILAPSPMPIERDALAAVMAVEGAGDLESLLQNALTSRLAAVGVRLVERERIRDVLKEIQFQNLGITDSATASAIGQALNARFLVFGRWEAANRVAVLFLRLVAVESGEVVSTAELTCRDCTPDDYPEGARYLVDEWTRERD